MMEMRRKLRLQDEHRVPGSTQFSHGEVRGSDDAEALRQDLQPFVRGMRKPSLSTHTVQSSPTATMERSEEECVSSARHMLLSSGIATGFRMVYPTRCREGHLQEGPTRVEVDGDEFHVGRWTL